MAKCPATMCPLFAPDGSKWTGEQNANCPENSEKCEWWQGFGGTGCDGCTAANMQVIDVMAGGTNLQLAVVEHGLEKKDQVGQAAAAKRSIGE